MKRIKYFFIRNWYLLFNKSKCINITFGNYYPDLGGYFLGEESNLKYLGNNWFLLI